MQTCIGNGIACMHGGGNRSVQSDVSCADLLLTTSRLVVSTVLYCMQL
uniref:Uncharacterized protein n=1 Tax=Triticum urartu TaxID=4572 RepID=A0A8R7PU64_TRIUA